MPEIRKKLAHVSTLLKCAHAELRLISIETKLEPAPEPSSHDSFIHVPFKGTELYLLHKAFIDAGGAPSETYKSILEKTAGLLANKNQKGFSVESLQKNSDKVDYECKENVKRFLMKMIRNIDSY